MQCPYNIKVLMIIIKIKKRYYCKKTKTWYLPLKEYEAFKVQLSDYREFEFEVKRSKPVVFIKTIADRIEIEFSKLIDEFKKYFYFEGRRFHASEKKINMPKEHLEAVIK